MVPASSSQSPVRMTQPKPIIAPKPRPIASSRPRTRLKPWSSRSGAAGGTPAGSMVLMGGSSRPGTPWGVRFLVPAGSPAARET